MERPEKFFLDLGRDRWISWKEGKKKKKIMDTLTIIIYPIYTFALATRKHTYNRNVLIATAQDLWHIFGIIFLPSFFSSPLFHYSSIL